MKKLNKFIEELVLACLIMFIVLGVMSATGMFMDRGLAYRAITASSPAQAYRILNGGK